MLQLAERPLKTATLASVIAEDLKPIVRAIDAEGLYPADVLRRLGDVGAFAHHLDDQARNGGLAAAIDAMAQVGAVCVSTAFCMWCQDALAWYLDRSENRNAAPLHLDAVASGRHLGGTGLSNPMKAFSGIEPLSLKGQRVPGGYRVSGRLPWVSNLDDGHLFASIFALADERRVMALFRAGDDGVTLARNARFIALEGTGTYSILVRDAFVPDDHVLAEDAAVFVPAIRNGFVLLQAGMGLGIARGVAALMRSDVRGRKLAAFLPLGPDEIEDRTDALWQRVREHAESADAPDRSSFLAVLRTRLQLSQLALDAAQSAMLQFGARGYVEGSEPFRRLREAQFVAIVTPSVKHILTELARG
jgi:alkylation response protein AidB-like acyl-CoA dehydrogenase